MIRPTAFAYLVLISVSFITPAQGQAENQNVALNDAARDWLQGDWVKISEQNQEQIDAARQNFCDRNIFDDGAMKYQWHYNKMSMSTDIPILRGAKGNLAFRFNGPDDLYAASVSLEMTGLVPVLPQYTDISVRRASELRMDLNGNTLGVTYGYTNNVLPAAQDTDVVPWVRHSLIVQPMDNQITGETYFFARFEMGPNYGPQKDTALYVKCA